MAEECSCDLCRGWRRAAEFERAAKRLLDPEWLAERLWRYHTPTADPRDAARAIIAEARKP